MGGGAKVGEDGQALRLALRRLDERRVQFDR